MCDIGDVSRTEAELDEEVGSGTGVAELVVYADALDRNRVIL